MSELREATYWHCVCCIGVAGGSAGRMAIQTYPYILNVDCVVFFKSVLFLLK